MHGVGAVTDDYAVNPVLDLFTYGDGQLLVLLRSHVFAENGKQFFGGEVANIGQFRHCAV